MPALWSSRTISLNSRTCAPGFPAYGVGTFRREKGDRAVSPEIFKRFPGAGIRSGQLVFVEFLNGQKFDARHAEVLQVGEFSR